MNSLATTLFLSAFSSAALAQTVLISPTVRNGGFEDVDSTSFATTPFWESYFPEADAVDLVLPTNPKSGSLRGFVNGYQGSGTRIHPAQTIPAAEWTVAEGDVFSVKLAARSGFNLDISEDALQCILEVVDSNGNPIEDPNSSTGFSRRLLSSLRYLTATGTYQDLTFISDPVLAGSPWIGNSVKLRLLNTGDRDEYTIIDDVTLTAYREGELDLPLALLASYQAEGNSEDSLAPGTDAIPDVELSYGSGFGVGQSFQTQDGGLTIPMELPVSYSLSFWFRTSELGTEGTTLSWRDGSVLLDASNGNGGMGVSLVGERVAFTVGSKTLFSRSLLTDDKWHHLTVTHANTLGSIQLFVDGLLEDFGAVTPGESLANDLVAGRSRALDRPFDGFIDDLRIYQGLLDKEAIEEIRTSNHDTDGDGSSDAEEAEAGTDRGNANDYLQVDSIEVTDEGVNTVVTGKKLRGYELQRLSGLDSSHTSTTVDSRSPLPFDSELSLTDSAPPAERGFYQITAAKGSPVKPNIVMIVGDDHGYADLSAYAHSQPDIATPNLDRIAASGVRFTQAYTTSPVCSPSRTGFLTGRYQNEWDPSGGWVPGLPATSKHLAEYLDEAGYTTAMIGKNDFGQNLFFPTGREYPGNHGFDEFFGFNAHAHDFFLHSQAITDSSIPAWPGEASAHLGQFLNSEAPTNYETLADGIWQTQEFTDRAIDFVEEQEAESEPFFLYLSHASVHALIHQVPKSYLDEVGVTELPIYDPTTNVPGNPANYNTYYYEYSRPAPIGPISDADMRKYYRAHLKAFDDQIGRLLDSLESTGQLNNTLIVYFSDNGGEALTGANNQPLSGSKYNMFEGGIRVPMLMSWPGVLPANQVYDEIVSTLDVVPTLLEAAGVEEAPQLRGFPLLSPLRENRPILKTDRTLFWRFNDYWAVRRGDWKLLFSDKGINITTSQITFNPRLLGREGLINLATDPSESSNQASSNDPEIIALKAELRALFEAWEASNQN
ncbi:sulfatase-like hydrolase/transferase [Roseibacillus persicicus]|uniref:sulfatase-like hydrolase/transferase n=1 Tax=Roseibacillus persicicus TaxID=454148 RepID=UPI00280CEC4F|nr:sulfatase-like hydrolase/transferase [Roseibacillus persicicus]MDQ8191557.1 sulfatase-like hydrolase/transferase [Roseibacillus persicicus]